MVSSVTKSEAKQAHPQPSAAMPSPSSSHHSASSPSSSPQQAPLHKPPVVTVPAPTPQVNVWQTRKSTLKDVDSSTIPAAAAATNTTTATATTADGEFRFIIHGK